MNHVIIGAGPAGVIAAETLRKVDRDAGITVVGDEPEPPYSRMALPYFLCGNIEESGTWLRKTADHYEGRGIEIVRDRVASLDTAARKATLASGATLGYDRLLVATGSSPVTPPIAGVDTPGVHTCWTLEDARAIAGRAADGAGVVLMGAGFIGCIVLEALVQRGLEVTVVEMGNRMVPRMMNETAGGLIKAWCESKGVAVHTSAKVESIEADGAKLSVRLDDGKTLAADLVIQATGVKPNIGFLDGSGIGTDTGVKVDGHLRSSDPNVFAAGDVAEGPDFSTGGWSVHAIQPTGAEHGRVAALNMAGHETAYQGSLNMNVLDTIGLVSTSFGQWMGVDGGTQAELVDADGYRYLNLQFRDDVLVGASSLGVTEGVGVLRGLIQSRTRLGRWAEHLRSDPTRWMEAYVGSTQAIGANAYAFAQGPLQH